MKKKFLLIMCGFMLIICLKWAIENRPINSKDILGVYVNNELTDTIPLKDSSLFIKAICDDENVKVSWNNDVWGLLVSNMSKKTKCNLYFYSGQIKFNYDYTGSEQIFTAPISGIYKLETWGAQGSLWNGGPNYEYFIYGGVGGYSSGTINLSKNENVYINVGGQAKSGIQGPKGGEATYITVKSGLLQTFEKTKSNILIVSGGGGGSEWLNGQGGAGGGYIGGFGTKDNKKHTTGGTQDSGGKSASIDSNSGTTKIYDGSFGKGGYSADGDGGGSGGDGFYGGGASSYAYGGAGGSGYIGNSLLTNKVMYCYNCEESNEESTKTISTTCSKDTPTSNCAKKGNGYARITLISIDE